jgi:hypothetical protein
MIRIPTAILAFNDSLSGGILERGERIMMWRRGWTAASVRVMWISRPRYTLIRFWNRDRLRIAATIVFNGDKQFEVSVPPWRPGKPRSSLSIGRLS